MKTSLRNLSADILSNTGLGRSLTPDKPPIVDVSLKQAEVPTNKEMAAAVAAGLVPVAGDESDYQDAPSVPHQMEKFPRSVMHGPNVIDQFDLGDNIGKDALNKLLEGEQPASAPRIKVLGKRVEFSPQLGRFIVCVSYQRLRYLKRVSNK